MFTKNDVMKIAASTSVDGIRNVQDIDSDDIFIRSSNSRVCFGKVKSYDVSINSYLGMHCTCRAWEIKGTPCKHGCALALRWLHDMPTHLLPIEEVVKAMTVSELVEKVTSYAKGDKALDDLLRN